MIPTPITTLFLDIGQVLLTNGWDRHSRRLAAEQFGLDFAEMDERHHLTFDTYEEGKLSLNDYLKRVVFYEKRPFTLQNFKEFMFDQSRPLPDMLPLMTALKDHYQLQVAAVSNEGRELAEYRIRQFQLDQFIDTFIVSSFVHIRKPDADIYRLALDVTQSQPKQVVYIDDRAMLVDVARSLGIHGIHHTSHASTRHALAQLGLTLETSGVPSGRPQRADESSALPFSKEQP
ncbi:MAG: HAD family phosphatase [Ardenticatenaceae bacterium]|nr:HAD family phosphatase [Ardenticatenaceae bacterium]MCB9445228.1 HAD family phosphatase [Ardenticatenaceae bacterium]